MSVDRNKQIVLDFYEAGRVGDMDTCFALMADDIVWSNIGSTRFSGTYTGKQAIVDELIGPLFGQLKAGIASTVERLIGEGETVVALTQGRAELQDGTPYNNVYCQIIEIRDGRIAAVREYMDTALIDAAFGRD